MTAQSFHVPADEAQKLHGPTWGEELRTLEYQRRRTVDPELLKGPAIRITQGAVRAQERVFDPLVQRFRDPAVESHKRTLEENTRVGHLNRAMDVQLLREQPWNVVTNAARLEGLDGSIDPVTLTAERPRHGRSKMPDTFVDYNLLSNLPMEEHHWAPPHERPVGLPSEPKNRRIPASLMKDYDIVNNRYVHDHEQQLARDKELSKLQATAKHRERNRFNPLTQQYTDGDENVRMRSWEEAHKIEAVEKAQAQICPTIKHRPSSYWNIINHRQANSDTLKSMDLAEDERKERYKNRYIVENNLHSRDVNSDQIENERRLNRIDHERFAEPMRRGYDIVTHDQYGGRKSKPPYLPYPCPSPDVWERVKRNRSVPSDFGARTLVAPEPDGKSQRSGKSGRLPPDARSERSRRSVREDGRSERSRRSDRSRARSEPQLMSARPSERSRRDAPPIPRLSMPHIGGPAVGYAPAAG